MASKEGVYVRGAGAGEQVTGGIVERTEEEIKEIAREHGASWQMPPTGLYVFEIYEVSEKVEALSKGGKEYTYRQVLGYLSGKSGNLQYDGEILIKVLGTQAEIFRRIAESDSRKCLIDVRKWNGMNRIQGVYGLDYILQLLDDTNAVSERKELQERIK